MIRTALFAAAAATGARSLKSAQLEVGVNRTLQSLLDPKAVAKDVMKR